MFLTIWMVVGALCIVFGFFQAGRTGDLNQFLWIPVGVMWPIMLGVLAIAAPFIGIYYLGKFFKQSIN